MSSKSVHRQFTADEVFRHRFTQDLYIVIHGKVYNITKFANEHPGGIDILVEQGGRDATEAFDEVQHSEDAHEILESLQVGALESPVGDNEALGGTASKTNTSTKLSEYGSWGYKFYLLLLLSLAVGFGGWVYHAGFFGS